MIAELLFLGFTIFMLWFFFIRDPKKTGTYNYLCFNCGVNSQIEFGSTPYCSYCNRYSS